MSYTKWILRDFYFPFECTIRLENSLPKESLKKNTHHFWMLCRKCFVLNEPSVHESEEPEAEEIVEKESQAHRWVTPKKEAIYGQTLEETQQLCRI